MVFPLLRRVGNVFDGVVQGCQESWVGIECLWRADEEGFHDLAADDEAFMEEPAVGKDGRPMFGGRGGRHGEIKGCP